MKFKEFLYESFHRPRRYLANLFDEPAIVLLYHRVTTLNNDPQLLSLKPDNFYRQIQYLAKQYTLLQIDEFVDHLHQKRKFPRRSIIITFDDGYADNYLQARPILESLNAQAIFYVTTSLLSSTREFWWDELDRIFLTTEGLPDELALEIDQKVHRYKTASATQRMETYNALHPLMKYATLRSREDILQQLRQWASVGEEGRLSHRIMTIQEAAALAKSPAALLGAHTHTHTPLRILSAGQQREDILQSKTILENITGRPIKHFSYPYGLKKDYDARSIELCKELGFSMASANFYDQVHRSTDPFQVPRIIVRDWPLELFQRKLQHFFRA